MNGNKGPLTVIISPTRRCNLQCRYCKIEKEGEGDNCLMDDETLVLTFRELSKALKRFRVLWHGGEPGLAGAAFYERAVALQPLNTFNIVQTNGMINDEVLEVWQRLSFQVGASLDLPLSVNAMMRHENPRSARKRIAHLKRFAPKVGLLAVINSDNVHLARSMVSMVIREQFKFSIIHQMPDLAPTPQEYGDFLIWWGKKVLKDPRLCRLEPIRELILNVVSGESRYCSFRQNCQDYFLAVDPQGDVYPCNRFMGQKKCCFGNIRDGLEMVLESPLRLQFADRWKKLVKGQCADCRWFEVCYGGCPFEGGLDAKDPYCESYRAFRNEILNLLIKNGAKDVVVNEKTEIA